MPAPTSDVFPLRLRLIGVNMLALASFPMVPDLLVGRVNANLPPDLRFIPQFAYAYVRALTGTLSTSPTIKIGFNGPHSNICPVYTPPTSVTVDSIGALPLAAALKAANLASDVVSLEVSAVAVGPTVMTADVLLLGVVVKGNPAQWL